MFTGLSPAHVQAVSVALNAGSGGTAGNRAQGPANMALTSSSKALTAAGSPSKNRSQYPGSNHRAGPSSTTPSSPTLPAQVFGSGWMEAKH